MLSQFSLINCVNVVAMHSGLYSSLKNACCPMPIFHSNYILICFFSEKKIYDIFLQKNTHFLITVKLRLISQANYQEAPFGTKYHSKGIGYKF